MAINHHNSVIKLLIPKFILRYFMRLSWKTNLNACKSTSEPKAWWLYYSGNSWSTFKWAPITVAIHDQGLGRLCNIVDSQRKFGETLLNIEIISDQNLSGSIRVVSLVIHQKRFEGALLLVPIRGRSFDGLYYSGDSLLNFGRTDQK